MLCQTFAVLNLSAQCNLTDCPDDAVLTSGVPFYNGTGITVPAIKFNNIYCPNGNSAIDIYLYQLLPNGERMDNCNVIGNAPNNIVGRAQVYFGAPSICIDSLFLIDIDITEADGFSICDGAIYEVVLALWVDDVNNGTLVIAEEQPATVYEIFPNEEGAQYIDYVAGIVTVEVENSDIDYPLIVNEIYEWDTYDTNTIYQTCEDFEFFAAGYSLLANCTPLSDYSNGIGSEIYNTLSYSINGSPSSSLITNTNGIGGPVSGNCYGGILTEEPVVLEASNMGLAVGDVMTITLTTTDFFTNESVSSSIVIEFEACEIECLPANNINAAAISDNGATITWSSPINEDGFIVEIRLKYSNNWVVQNTSVNFIILSNLASCEEYEYRITNTCDYDTFTSDIQEFSTIGCSVPCQALQGLFNNNATENSIVLAWDIYPNAFSYTLYYRRQGDALWYQDTDAIPLVILFGLPDCSNWEWYVVVNCDDGTFSPPSSIAYFSTTGCLKDDVITTTKDFYLYPNPAANYIQFEQNNEIEWETVYISNSVGQIFEYWSTDELSNNSINLQNYDTGVYFLHFLSYEGITSERFTINK